MRRASGLEEAEELRLQLLRSRLSSTGWPGEAQRARGRSVRRKSRMERRRKTMQNFSRS
jgi:hypothetical protein